MSESDDDFQVGATEEFLANANDLDGSVSLKDWQATFAQQALGWLGENLLCTKLRVRFLLRSPPPLDESDYFRVRPRELPIPSQV